MARVAHNHQRASNVNLVTKEAGALVLPRFGDRRLACVGQDGVVRLLGVRGRSGAAEVKAVVASVGHGRRQRSSPFSPRSGLLGRHGSGTPDASIKAVNRLLRIHETDDRAVDIEPVGGRLVCFLTPGRVHEVLPARRERLSISGWFRGRE
jgi:2-oxoglutarate-Fe(II)-dependent oxygenase superfamily protein